MEYVIVRYEESRSVFIEDDVRLGPTNQTLWIDEGTHVFTLGEPKDYKPSFVKTAVSGTAKDHPLEVRFEKV